MQIDDTDQKLLALLRDNARMPVAELARALGLARTTVQARIERLENARVIAGYTLRASDALRPPLRATVLISVEPRSAPTVLGRLRGLTGVEVVHTTSGRFDLLVQVTAMTTAELDETLDHIGGARGVRSSESLIHLATKIDRVG
ncbi:MAG: DNA-binding Lrp family transcriptional regulator [Paracoccaceae bacterium]|jgi:DNA-binding Lrp family transcriptional regulator